MLLAFITDPFQIFHQIFFRFLTSSQFSKGTHDTQSTYLHLRWPHLCRCLDILQQLSKYTSQFQIPETAFWYSPHQHPPSEPSLLLSVSSISETDQFPTIQKGSLITHYKLPFLGLFQGLIPDRLVLFLLPLLLLFLLRLPFLMLLFIAFTGCCYSSLGLLFNAPLFSICLS